MTHANRRKRRHYHNRLRRIYRITPPVRTVAFRRFSALIRYQPGIGKNRQSLGNDRFTFIRCDIHDIEIVRRYIAQSSTVVLLAALCNPSQYNTRTLDVIDVNCIGTIPLVRACAESRVRLVYFSTSEVYKQAVASLTGNADDRGQYLLREDESPFILGPISALRWSYACAKQLIERVIDAFGREHHLNYTIVRPFDFIGPRMDFLPGVDGEGLPRVLSCFLGALMSGAPLKLVDGGRNRRSFTAIGDAIDACVKILERPDPCRNQIFNLATRQMKRRLSTLPGSWATFRIASCPLTIVPFYWRRSGPPSFTAKATKIRTGACRISRRHSAFFDSGNRWWKLPSRSNQRWLPLSTVTDYALTRCTANHGLRDIACYPGLQRRGPYPSGNWPDPHSVWRCLRHRLDYQ